MIFGRVLDTLPKRDFSVPGPGLFIRFQLMGPVLKTSILMENENDYMA